MNNNLGVTGTSNFGGAVSMNSSLGVTGTSNFGGAVSMNNNLLVSGNTNINGTLGVTGTSLLNGAVTMNNTLGVTGNTTIGGTLTVNNNSTLNGTLSVSNSATVGGDMTVYGTGHFNGGSFSLSDVSLKTDIVPIDNALDKVMNLNGIYYNWKDTSKFNDKHQVGLIAQDVEQVIPELVDTSLDGIKSVNYAQMVSVLVQAIKEQNTLITQLRNDVDTLKNAKKCGRKPKAEVV